MALCLLAMLCYTRYACLLCYAMNPPESMPTSRLVNGKVVSLSIDSLVVGKIEQLCRGPFFVIAVSPSSSGAEPKDRPKRAISTLGVYPSTAGSASFSPAGASVGSFSPSAAVFPAIPYLYFCTRTSLAQDQSPSRIRRPGNSEERVFEANSFVKMSTRRRSPHGSVWATIPRTVPRL